MTQPEVLIQVLEIIKNSRKFCLVHHTFSSEVVRRFILNKLCKPTAMVCVEILVWPCCFTCLIEFSNYTDNRTITTLLENLLWSWTWVILLCVVQPFCKSPAMKLGLCNFPWGHFLCCCFFPFSSPAEFSEVESDFHAKVPAVFCRDVLRWVLD